VSAACHGQGRTAEKDAFVIADQARMSQDLGLLRPGDEIAADLRTLTARRLDLVNDRARQTTRIRSHPQTGRPAPRGFSCSARC